MTTADADADIASANGAARAMTMAALLGRDDPKLGELLVELVGEALLASDLDLVLVRLAHFAADGLRARAQLEQLRGDPCAEELVQRMFTIDAAVEAGVIR